MPVLPLTVPGAGDSPGARMSRREKVPPVTVTQLEVSGPTAGVVTSLAQIRCCPLSASRVGIWSWPSTRVVSAGSQANWSLEPSAITSLTPDTQFQ